MSKRADTKPSKAKTRTEMRKEYDFSKGVRGKYYQAFKKQSGMVLLDPDVAAVFKDSTSVNEALRLLADLAKAQATRP